MPTILLLFGCFGSSLEQTENSFRDRMLHLDDLIKKTEGDLKKDTESKKSNFNEAYDRLPPKDKAEERTEALGKLNQESYAYLKTADQKLSEISEAKSQAEASVLAAYRLQFVGTWKSPEMELSITQDGSVDYKRLQGGIEKKVTAAIKSFEKDKFTVGFLGITTTFRIDKPPYEDTSHWQMVIDGVTLTRILP